MIRWIQEIVALESRICGDRTDGRICAGDMLDVQEFRDICNLALAFLRGEPNAARQELQQKVSDEKGKFVDGMMSDQPAPNTVSAAPEPLPEQVQQEIRRYSTIRSIQQDMEAIARVAIECERERVLRIRRRHAVPQPEHDDERLDDPRRGQAEGINERNRRR